MFVVRSKVEARKERGVIRAEPLSLRTLAEMLGKLRYSHHDSWPRQ
jgi:hypothetical protein